MLRPNVQKSQFLNLLQTLNTQDKLEMNSALKKSFLCDSMENLLSTHKYNELSIEDISETVEEVRYDRYKKGKQCI